MPLLKTQIIRFFQIITLLIIFTSCNQEKKTELTIEEINAFISDKNVAKIDKLLNKQNINLQDSTGLSPLTNAIRTKDIKIVQAILNKGANTNLQNKDYYGTTPIMYTVSSNLIDIATLLINNNANIDFQDKFGDPVIHWSAYYGNVEFTELLLKNNVNTNLKSAHSNGAMQVALKEYQDSVVDLLIDYNVSLNKVNIELKPLINAVKQNNIPFVKNNLTTKNANTKDEAGNTLLIIASEKGNLDMVKLLLEKKADINTISAVGHTAINRAVFFGRNNIVNYLLEHGADINKCDERFMLTPLMAAARKNRVDIGETLLKNKANINTTDGINNFSALMWATSYENIDFIKMILKYNPDLSIISNYDSTVLDLTQNEDILKLLKTNVSN